MSFQPPSQPYQPPTAASSGPTAPVEKRKTLILMVGALLLVGGLVGGLLVLMSSGSKTDQAVKKLARVPVGCTTTLNVEKPGTFNVYVETAGRLPEYDGNCPAGGKYSSSAAVQVDTMVTDDDGNVVEIAPATGESYSAAGYRGSRVGTVSFSKTGTYRISVMSAEVSDDQAAVAVGIDSSAPSNVASQDRVLSIALLVGGALFGIPLILLGLRRRPVTPSGPPTMGGLPRTPGPAGPVGYPPSPAPVPPVYQPPVQARPGYSVPRPGYQPPPPPRPETPGWGQPGGNEPGWRPPGDDTTWRSGPFER